MDNLNITDTLFKKNYLRVIGDITPELAKMLCSRLMVKILDPKCKELTLLIDSLGGCVSSTLMIYDLLQVAKQRGIHINTIVIGEACSSGCFLLVAGTKRYAMPNSIIMMHRVSYKVYTDYDTNNKEYQKFLNNYHERFYQIMANECFRSKTSKPESNLKDLMTLIHNSVWLTPEEAKNMGWIDEIFDVTKLNNM